MMLRTVLSFCLLCTLTASVCTAQPAKKAPPKKPAAPLPDKLQPSPDVKLAVKAVKAFPELRFRRPIVVTHANDGSNRLFVAEQEGVIRVFKNDADAEETSVFLDIEKQVVYKDKQNEEGLLGFAFHPDYKKNGQLFVYYTTTSEPQLSVISRFRVSKDDPNKVDPKTEEQIMQIKQPYWNHNGGTICFGHDGYLYVGLGDGGFKNDPHNNGQNLETLLGSILRIDVNKKANGKGYAIPADNPFVNQKNARDEIFAYGLRNVWRMSFDRETGSLWAADVGQNLWEEINIIEKGGNYGWNIREAMHPFEKKKSAAKMIDPIWEYHHAVGKSITGGTVYRGKDVPALVGKYLYADYVKTQLWALDYNPKTGKTTNYILEGPNLPVMSYGDDEQGEVYFTTPFGILYKFAAAK